MTSMSCFRSTLAAIGAGETVSHAELYAVFGLDGHDVDARRTVRRRCGNLVRQGELRRVGVGRYEIVPDAVSRTRGVMFDQVWRAMITARPGWTVADLVLVSGVSETHARRYLSWLLDAGYVARHGQDGRTAQYRATLAARERTATAYPPARPDGPYHAERRAMATMARLFACASLRQPQIRNKIAKCAREILERFGKEEES